MSEVTETVQEQLTITIPVERFEELVKHELMLKSYQVGKSISLPQALDIDSYNMLVQYLNAQRVKILNSSPKIPKEIKKAKTKNEA